MKNYLFLLSSIFFIQVSAQTIVVEGLIKDVQTQAPIDLVFINVEGSSTATVTNAEGRFRISVPEGSRLLFNHMGYNFLAQAIKNTVEVQEFFLESKSFLLDEVIVTTQSPVTIIKSIIAESEQQLPTDLLYHTYYREFCKLNDKYTTFSDGLLDYQIKRKKGTADLYVNQSRAMRITDPELSKKHQELSGITFFEVGEAFEEGYQFATLRRIADSTRYDYLVRQRTDGNGNTYHTISFSPKETVQEVLFEGSITYQTGSNNKLILSYDLKFAPSHLRYGKERKILWIYFNFLDFSKRTAFTINQGKYAMAYNKTSAKVHFRTKKKFNETLESSSDVVVLNFEEGEREQKNVKRFKGFSLYEAGTKYTEEFWKTRDILLLSAEEDAVVKSFEVKP